MLRESAPLDKFFSVAGIAKRRSRLIAGRAHDILPCMNEQSQGTVMVDAGSISVSGTSAARVGERRRARQYAALPRAAPDASPGCE